jgi:hypothetical protein
MLARLGDVLYWAGSGIAVLCFGLATFLWVTPPNPDSRTGAVIFATVAIVVWLIGRACRYVLAGAEGASIVPPICRLENKTASKPLRIKELWRRGWGRTHGTVTRTTVFEF